MTEAWSGKKCSIDGCDKDHLARTWCSNHYRAWRLYGDPLSLKYAARGSRFGAECSVAGCTRSVSSRGLCGCHYSRLRVRGETYPEKPIRKVVLDHGEWGEWHSTGHGYIIRKRRLNGRKESELQHRFIVEEYIGRKLLDHENIHHINGVRDDNRIENLELWSTSQPMGQRVVDKISWAIDILSEYEVLDAEGLERIKSRAKAQKELDKEEW